MFKVIITTNSCPAGQNRTKTKNADGTWDQVWSYSNGTPVEYPTKRQAEGDASTMDFRYADFVSARVEAA